MVPVDSSAKMLTGGMVLHLELLAISALLLASVVLDHRTALDNFTPYMAVCKCKLSAICFYSVFV